MLMCNALSAAEDKGLETGSDDYKAAVIDAMKNTDGLKGVTGTYKFDQYNNPIKSAAIMEDLLAGYYSQGKNLDIALSMFDGFSYGIAAALEGAGYKVGEQWPVITGQDAELMACKNILSGKQSQTIYKDTRVLAEKCVGMWRWTTRRWVRWPPSGSSARGTAKLPPFFKVTTCRGTCGMRGTWKR